jgi:single-stranded DNA-binding protein
MNIQILGGTVEAEPKPEVFQIGDDKKRKGSFRLHDGKGWHTVILWEALADKLPTPGQYVVVNGRSQTRSYEKNDGSKGYVTECVASTIDIPGATAEARPTKDVPSDLGF